MLALSEVNTFRMEHGLPAFQLDSDLTIRAIQRLDEVVTSQAVSHNGVQAYVRDVLMIELLGTAPEQYESVAHAVVWGWTHSPQHSALLLDPYWTKAGIAAAKADDGNTYFVLFLE